MFGLRTFFNRAFHPAQILLISFIVATLIGTALLKLPGTVMNGELSLVDAFFTATSSVCVTGLIVVDTASTFSPLGKFILLMLIQVGGLGIMTFSVMFVMMAGKRISFKEQVMIQDTFAHSPAKDLKSLIISVALLTFIIEFIGALILFARWSWEFPFEKAIALSVFHSVSAFCNAGFSLFSDSFMGYRGDIVINLTVAVLIILGGLGFLVLMEIPSLLFNKGKKRKQMTLHTKIVLIMSASLTVAGLVLFFLMERNNLLKDLDLWDSILASFFQSVTARTAGFNTVDINLLSPVTLFLMIIFMFIGASPGSTGGGIKTSTLGVLIALMKSRLMARENVNLFKRTLPKDVVARSLSIVLISFIVVILFTMVLLLTEGGNIHDPTQRGQFLEMLFEVVSAFGTVGLSTGITSSLSDAGKVTVSLLMLVGRLGPLTIALAIGKKIAEGRFQYSEERVMTG
ncbi:MAG: potassium-transporting ATPase subunit KdpA [Proteobacteria bacterium]|nr:potassium-transporting ATPase subunit KdpA [Pseudomonadota bacterium]